ncbi:MAG TPA: SDR family oxidoreductase [Polyangiaceae bacterium]|nr:SDR family oxidoreductase [Polyangiaceae bacterium]
MKLCITGALGHIGSRLIHDIRPGEFDEVRLIDNFATQRYASLFDLPDGVPFRFVEADILQADLPRLFTGMDAVVHLAAITNAAGSFAIQEQVEAVNHTGTERVAEACLAAGARLVFLSTTSVYGTAKEVVDESASEADLKPQSPYALSKRRAELLLAELGARRGLRSVSLRFGTIYGASIGMRFHTAVNKFCLQATLGEPVSVWRTALDQKRPYLELGDAVRALRFVLERELFDGQIYNVLTDNLTVRDIVDTIRRFVPELELAFVDAAIMNQLSYTVSCDKFRRLGFRFEGDLVAGIGETLERLKNARAARV